MEKMELLEMLKEEKKNHKNKQQSPVKLFLFKRQGIKTASNIQPQANNRQYSTGSNLYIILKLKSRI